MRVESRLKQRQKVVRTLYGGATLVCIVGNTNPESIARVQIADPQRQCVATPQTGTMQDRQQYPQTLSTGLGVLGQIEHSVSPPNEYVLRDHDERVVLRHEETALLQVTDPPLEHLDAVAAVGEGLQGEVVVGGRQRVNEIRTRL